MVTSQMTFDSSFYESKIHTMKFYYKFELPKIEGNKITLMHQDSLTMIDEHEKVFA